MSRWEPDLCHHEKQGLAGGCEECYDESTELTSIATQRVTLESVVAKLKARAAKLWINASEYTDNGKIAEEVRNLARDFEKEAKEFSAKQDELLKRDEKNRQRLAGLRKKAGSR